MRIILALTLIYSILNCIYSKSSELNVKNIKVFGPGLSPDKLVLPVRYFFIQVYDNHGKRIRHSLGDVFKVNIEGRSASGTYCQAWIQVMNRHDGTYIVRYRTYQTCLDTSIHVLYDNQHVADSPYKIHGPIYSEDCYCPLNDINSFMETYNCPSEYKQIINDLRPFNKVNFNSVLKEATVRYNQTGSRSFCNYVVVNNEVYRKCYGMHTGFKMFMDNILHSILKKVNIPDIEFIINLGDWPLVDQKISPLLPIFSWCGSDDTVDIVLPTYDLTEATLEMMGRVMMDILSVQTNNDISWENKKSLAFWRGRDSRQERLDLIDISRNNPALINASLTNFFFFKDQEEKYGPKEKHISFFKFFDYKYQLNIDGTVASYRLPYLLAGNGVVMKQESPYYEFFYKNLKPYKHYLPFKRDLSDLVEKIKWALDNDSKMKDMRDEAQKFALNNLLPIDVFCYHIKLFEEWSKRLISKISIRPDMEHVPILENKKRFGDCNCHRQLNVKHDEF